MTLVLAGAHQERAQVSLLKPFVNLIRELRRAHMRQKALVQLMEMDDVRLTDLGLSRTDIQDALQQKTPININTLRRRGTTSASNR